MRRKKIMLTANADCKLKEFGARIKRPTVSIGAYVAVLVVLGIDSDIDTIATDENAKKQLYEQNLLKRKRASSSRTE